MPNNNNNNNNNNSNNNKKERTKTGAPFQQQLLAFVSSTRLETKPGAPCVVLRGGCCSSFPFCLFYRTGDKIWCPECCSQGGGLLFRCCSAVVPQGLCLSMGRSNKAWCPVRCSGGGGVVLEGAGRGGAGECCSERARGCDKRSQCT